MIEHKLLKGIFVDGRNIFTKNLVRGMSHFGEELRVVNNVEYRYFDPRRSKLAAAIMNGVSQIGIKEGSVILYLGASHGYTVSFISDIVGKNGFIFAVDSSPRVVRDLVDVCEKRRNIAPLLFDANIPQRYIHLLTEVDVVYQDIAQRNQVEIFLKNCRMFLKNGGFAIIAIKSRSIDVAKNPIKVFEKARKEIEKEMIVVDYRILNPFQKDHAFLVCKKK